MSQVYEAISVVVKDSASANHSRNLRHLIRNYNFHIPRGSHTVSVPDCKALLLPTTSSSVQLRCDFDAMLDFNSGILFSRRPPSDKDRTCALTACNDGSLLWVQLQASLAQSLRQACSSAIADVICQLDLLRQQSPWLLHKQIMRATAV